MEVRIVLSLASLFDIHRFEAAAAAYYEANAGPTLKRDTDNSIQTRYGEDTPLVDALNDTIWENLPTLRSQAKDFIAKVPTISMKYALVSEYGLLTTNLARSALLGTQATRLGKIYVGYGALTRETCFEALQGIISDFGCRGEHCEVLVTSRTQYEAAEALGMKPIYAFAVRPALRAAA